MNTFLTGVHTMVTSWQTPLAIVVLMIGAYMWIRGHHFAGVMEMAAGLAILFTISTVATQLGF